MIGFMGSTVDPKPNDLPIALVVEDKGVKSPNNTLNFGETVKENLITNQEIPFKWSIVQSKEEALSKMNDRAYYAAIVIPENTSLNIASILQPSQQQPQVEVIINEGMNYTASNTVSQIIDQIGMDMNSQIQSIIFSQLQAQSLSLPPEKIEQVINPVSYTHLTLPTK